MSTSVESSPPARRRSASLEQLLERARELREDDDSGIDEHLKKVDEAIERLDAIARKYSKSA